MDFDKFKNDIFLIRTEKQFQSMALTLYNYQAKENEIYKSYSNLLKIQPKTIDCIEKIPFLPIDLFKENKILCQKKTYEKVFFSSGTTNQKKSKNYVHEISFYEKSIQLSFERRFGKINSYKIFCLTPKIKKSNQSSLIHMCNFLVQESGHAESGFYWNNYKKLNSEITAAQCKKTPFILIGLSFLILDFAKKCKTTLDGGIVIETGGKKNKQKEICREELYFELKKRLKLNKICSEYSMTELLSQSYSLQNGHLSCPPWKKILIRDYSNPLKIMTKTNVTGGINIIDLANIYSCAFIATNDMGRKHKNHYEVLGRLNSAAIRGCNNMI